jgi:hypothetical protein
LAASPSPPRPAEATPSPSDATRIAGWTLLSWAAVQFAAALTEQYAMVAIAIQALIAWWGAEQMGVAWTEAAASDRGRSTASRVALGALVGSLAAGLVVLLAVATHAAAYAKTPPALELLALGLLVAWLTAVRDELLLRGALLRLTRGVLPPWLSLLLCAAAAAGARFGTTGATGLALGVEALRGLALAGVWMRDRGAWMACAANAGWALVLGPVVHGGVLDVRFAAEADATIPALGVTAAASLAALGASLWPLPVARARLR